MFDFSTPVNRYGTYCTQWDYVQDRFGEADLLPFTISDMDFETAPCIQQALQQRLAHGVLGYSRWNHNDFKQAVTGWFAKRYQAELDQEALVYGPSVIYIISQLITQWSQPGDGILVHTPAYDAFGNMLEANQRQLLPSPLLKTAQGYDIDWQQFEQQAARQECKVLLLCSPHNPTGRVWRRNELERMADICQRHSVKVISDDIHMDMAYSQYLPWSEIATGKDWALVSSGSKSFNIPALTGAYAFIPNSESREHYLKKLKAAHGLSSPSILGIIAHIAAYQQADDWLDALKDYLQQNLITVAERFNNALPEVNYQVPEGTYLAWIDLNPLNIDMDALQQVLIHEHKVAIMRGDTYGEEGKGYIRLNVGCPLSKVEAGLDALITAIKQIQP
ncbi:pyridoxal phosphate-dependent aminotransferase [Photobacterium sp. ZSDE20]|uniref:cysteine-S-conjugate beta-lyase n=1 Tax=Photobacterium pectinilyticum TaxID=2906793 RepID=A0ABT1N6W7_9GAMM|nr:MalY/PatB family protein [Photobacterium sp. ZSDE20]MCQ1060487.1 pyridoxal phosphate-dependent aminotransferase [Photobacterium sp. ZSDE20]MDD1827887.1 pyridoxal phosphate-dependent aminotransferase [Photobacterium sp. ZSDE20]